MGDKKKIAFKTKEILIQKLCINKDLVNILEEILFPNTFKDAKETKLEMTKCFCQYFIKNILLKNDEIMEYIENEMHL